jgi:hypothetical protein
LTAMGGKAGPRKRALTPRRGKGTSESQNYDGDDDDEPH